MVKVDVDCQLVRRTLLLFYKLLLGASNRHPSTVKREPFARAQPANSHIAAYRSAANPLAKIVEARTMLVEWRRVVMPRRRWERLAPYPIR